MLFLCVSQFYKRCLMSIRDWGHLHWPTAPLKIIFFSFVFAKHLFQHSNVPGNISDPLKATQIAAAVHMAGLCVALWRCTRLHATTSTEHAYNKAIVNKFLMVALLVAFCGACDVCCSSLSFTVRCRCKETEDFSVVAPEDFIAHGSSASANPVVRHCCCVPSSRGCYGYRL